MRRAALIAGGMLAACNASHDADTAPPVAPTPLQSGYVFLTEETQNLQDDPFENPGYLWVDRGDTLFHAADEATPSCASCHEGGLVGIATQYPKIDSATNRLMNLEGRINQCRTTQQALPTLDYESETLLALTAYVAAQSRGETINRDLTEDLKPYIQTGRDYFQTRRGQFNLSCVQCHDENWGKRLRGDTISQGHGNGFPAYRFEWQSLGSLQRRLRDCDTGVRAEPLPYGDETYIAVELYLSLRASGLEIESPAVRR